MAKLIKYAVIGPVKVDGITAQYPDMISGIAMPTSIAGLSHKIALDVSREGSPIHSIGAAVVIHDHSDIEGHEKHPLEDKQKISANKGAAIVEELKSRATITLVAKFECEGSVQDTILAYEIERLVPGLYFSGGKIFPSQINRKMVSVCGQSEIHDLLGKVNPGHLLLDRHDLLTAQVNTGRDSLDALLDIIERIPCKTDEFGADGKEKVEYTRRYPGWLVPIFVGYQAIEHPQIRKGVRCKEAIGHVYAESAYSVGEYKSLRTLLAKDPASLEKAFWRHCHDPITETFFVSALELS